MLLKKFLQTLKLFSVFLLFAVIGCGDFGRIEWAGVYEYEKDAPITLRLIINKEKVCLYEGDGISAYFKINCTIIEKDNVLEVYFHSMKEGIYSEEKYIDKTQPLYKLYYSEKKLYTDELQPESIKERGRLKFVKKS